MGMLDAKGELVYFHPGTSRLFGLDLVAEGGSLVDLVHPDDRAAAIEALARDRARPGTHPPSVYRVGMMSGEWRHIEVVATNCLDDPAVAGIVMNGRDVTERTDLARVLRTLSAGNRALVSATDEASLLDGVCRTVVDVGGYLLAWVGLVEHDEAHTVRPVAWAGEPSPLEGGPVTWADDDHGRSPVGAAIRTREVQVDDVGGAGASGARRAGADELGRRASCALPLHLNGEVIGALTIYAPEPSDFSAVKVALLTELADDLSYGIGRLRDGVALKASEERFRALASEAPIGIAEMSPVALIDYANPRLAEITGRSVEALMGRRWVDAVHPDDLPGVMATADTVHRDRSRATWKFRICRPNGEVRHVRALVAPRAQEINRADIIVTVEDITGEVEAHAALARQTFYDPLTGLPNRALFLERLNDELAEEPSGGKEIAVLFLDLDHFKIVNDSLGYHTGDAVLREIGDRFVCGLKEGETAARFSGDEFVFIIKGVGGAEDAAEAARRFLGLLEPPVGCAEQYLRVTASIGIVVPDHGADAATILRDADTAMYRAKAAGRNCYATFDNDLHVRSVKRFSMEGELHQAIERHEFEVYYQPTVKASTGHPFGAESLVRWHHPERGLVPPLRVHSRGRGVRADKTHWPLGVRTVHGATGGLGRASRWAPPRRAGRKPLRAPTRRPGHGGHDRRRAPALWRPGEPSMCRGHRIGADG